jgi:Ras-related protein Rab-21
MTQKNNVCLKVLLLGNSGVGKSSLARRFVDNEFSFDFITTLGVDFVKKMVTAEDGRRVNLIIYDMAGQLRFKSIIAQYFRGTSGAIVAFDRADDDSFRSLRSWIEMARGYAKDLPVVLVETKCDKNQDENALLITQKDVQSLAQELNCSYLRTSAKDGYGVVNVFQEIVHLMLRNLDQEGEATEHVNLYEDSVALDLALVNRQPKRRCC